MCVGLGGVRPPHSCFRPLDCSVDPTLQWVGEASVRNSRKLVRVFPSQINVLTRCAQPTCVYTQCKRMITQVTDPWITETQKDPACTLLTEG